MEVTVHNGHSTSPFAAPEALMASTYPDLPGGPSGRDPSTDPGVRIGDADRERVASLVSEAAAVGYLDLAELDERLEAVWSARTAGQLERATADLPPEWLGGRQRPRGTGSPARSHQAAHGRRPAGVDSRDFQRHLASYLAGMAVMVTIWLAVGIASGSWYPWVIWPALGWGLGVVGRARRRTATTA
jgi:Domain of unknown function (DUF1707)/2TM domain